MKRLVIFDFYFLKEPIKTPSALNNKIIQDCENSHGRARCNHVCSGFIIVSQRRTLEGQPVSRLSWGSTLVRMRLACIPALNPKQAKVQTKMRKKEDHLAAPCGAFADLHPALSVIETLIGEQNESVAETGRLAEQLARANSEIDPTAWTSKIEAARDNAEELAKLRVQYDEKAITFMSIYLDWHVVRSRMYDGRSKLSDAICELIIAHDEIPDRGDQAHIKPIMKARAVLAMEAHRSEPKAERANIDFAPVNFDSLVKMANEYVVAAFNRLIDYLPDAKRGGRTYTTDCVVHGRTYLSHLNDNVDLRAVRCVPFKDCVNSKHPASEKLARMLAEARDRLNKLRSVNSQLRGDQNGSVNERQHAHRLIQFLHRDNATEPQCGGNLDAQVESQNARRFDYECHRQLLQIEYEAFERFVEELLETLEASVQEGVELLADIEGDSRATIDKLETVKIIMINCLAADLSLRFYSAQLQEIYKSFRNDLSRGAGARGVESRFETVQKEYGWSVNRRKESRAAEDSEQSDSGGE